MDPWGTVGSINKGEYYTLDLTTCESSGPYGFGEEVFFFIFFSNCKSKGAIDPPRVGSFLPQGHSWHDLCQAPHNNAWNQT